MATTRSPNGLWRGVDILIGIALGPGVFLRPAAVTRFYWWRYNLADALRDCATVYGRIITVKKRSAPTSMCG